MARRRLLDTAFALWPLPALLAWAAAWSLFVGLRAGGVAAVPAASCGAGAAAALALLAGTPLRRWVIGLGFPVSLLAVATAGTANAANAPALAGWAWLVPLAVLALAYPMSAWRDAPLFPTPKAALDALATEAPLPPGATVLDAGCGLGHGLAALRRAYPEARLRGVERSGPIAWLAKLACWRAGVRAAVERGDMWAGRWSGCAMVYLFQRPESMPRAVAKARAELDPGAWLASLEFPALGLSPQAVVDCPDGRTLWLYQAPFRPAAVASVAYVTATRRERAAPPSDLQRRRRQVPQ